MSVSDNGGYVKNGGLKLGNKQRNGPISETER